MPAGDPAATEARRQHALTSAPDDAAVRVRAAAGRYAVAASTVRRIARTLAPLTAQGHHVLADRAWPGGRRAPVDLVVVGPSGVFVIDTTAWTQVSVVGERLVRGEDDVTDDVLRVADLAYRLEGELAEVGLAPSEVRPVVVVAGRRGLDARVGPVRVVGEGDLLRAIAARGRRLTPHEVELVLATLVGVLGPAHPPVPGSAAVAEPVLPSQPEPVDDGPSLSSPAEVQAALLEATLAAPIEEWMAFLHPDQARLVRRSFSGPCRIRGPVGTGKTIVGLHRAAYLARTRPGAVLVTAYIRTLPAVLGSLLARMAPDVVDKVTLCGVHEVARRVLDERGIACQIRVGDMHAAWTAAWARVAAGTVLDSGPEGQSYWHDEVMQVIKGRAILHFDDYVTLPRLGRRLPLPRSAREVVWDLYVAYQEELALRDSHDYADQILMALAELERVPAVGTYSAIVVDEVQDLSCAMVRMLHALVGDVPDGLTLIGDGQQTVYPGGFTLAEAGVSVAGRCVLLDVNYRNTAQILAFASQLLHDDVHVDVEGASSHGDPPSGVLRHGVNPVFVRCAHEDDRSTRTVRRVQDVVQRVATGWGDVGVLCPTRRGVELAAAALTGANIPVVLLDDYDGVPVDAVKVGTVKRAKGLEFKQVLLTDVEASCFAAPPTGMDAVWLEARELRLRELYVAMTRARDGLWVAAV